MIAIIVIISESKKEKKILNILYTNLVDKFRLNISKSSRNYPELEGKVGSDYPIKIQRLTKGNGKAHFLAINIKLKKPRRYILTLTPGSVTKFEKMMGSIDIEIRDKEFDQKFVIECSNQLFAKALFSDYEINYQFLKKENFLKSCHLRIDNGNIIFESSNSIYYTGHNKQIIEIIELLISLAIRADELADNEDIF
jgi:hypothetical protein